MEQGDGQLLNCTIDVRGGSYENYCAVSYFVLRIVLVLQALGKRRCHIVTRHLVTTLWTCVSDCMLRPFKAGATGR